MGSPPAAKRRRTDGDRCSSDDAVLEEPGEIDAALARVDAMLATLAGASRPPSP